MKTDQDIRHSASEIADSRLAQVSRLPMQHSLPGAAAVAGYDRPAVTHCLKRHYPEVLV